MKKVCVVTATRAEYGVLKNILNYIVKDKDLELALLVTGSHLSKEFGSTINEIKTDGYPIDEEIDILMGSDTVKSISKTMGMAFILFSEALDRIKPDIIIVVGDRYELIPICFTATNLGIPIAHVSGGETTEGAIDECVRHCVTKMSYLHFPACEKYRKRIIQLGEHPERVFNYGDIGVENILKTDFMSKIELQSSLGFLLDKPYASVTFHPVTMETDSLEEQCEALLSAIANFPDMKFVFTSANADAGGKTINKKIEEFVNQHNNCVMFSSLGAKRYLSLLKHCDVIIGNSSSGIIEAPCFHKPTVNIGNRQAGRLKAESVIDCDITTADIVNAITKALSLDFNKIVVAAENPYMGENTSEMIVSTIKHYLYNNMIELRKKFYDLPEEVIN